MNVELVETEFRHFHVISVDVDYRDDKTLGGKLCIFVQTLQEVMKRDAGQGRRVEDGVTGRAFLFDEVGEEVSDKREKLL